jgi:hypothetical protein
MKNYLYLKCLLIVSCFGTIVNCFFAETFGEWVGWMAAAIFAHTSLLLTLILSDKHHESDETLDSNQ